MEHEFIAPQHQLFEFQNIMYRIFIGKNQRENDRLIDMSSPSDIWFHVSNSPSTHVILKNDDEVSVKQIPKQVLKRCACLCKSHSKSASVRNCEIMYTQIMHIEKTDVPGKVTVNKNHSKTIVI
jgi:predicted ribosome quality control (RQC) complex YloA/Tae2 family protein